MFTLYYKPTCPFCQRVLQMAETLHIELDLKDISLSDEALEELREKGGKTTVPFLVDSERGVSMYESSDIIDYLRETAKSVTPQAPSPRPRVHVGGSTCVSCEG